MKTESEIYLEIEKCPGLLGGPETWFVTFRGAWATSRFLLVALVKGWLSWRRCVREIERERVGRLKRILSSWVKTMPASGRPQ